MTDPHPATPEAGSQADGPAIPTPEREQQIRTWAAGSGRDQRVLIDVLALLDAERAARAEAEGDAERWKQNWKRAHEDASNAERALTEARAKIVRLMALLNDVKDGQGHLWSWAQNAAYEALAATTAPPAAPEPEPGRVYSPEYQHEGLGEFTLTMRDAAHPPAAEPEQDQDQGYGLRIPGSVKVCEWCGIQYVAPHWCSRAPKPPAAAVVLCPRCNLDMTGSADSCACTDAERADWTPPAAPEPEQGAE